MSETRPFLQPPFRLPAARSRSSIPRLQNEHSILVGEEQGIVLNQTPLTRDCCCLDICRLAGR